MSRTYHHGKDRRIRVRGVRRPTDLKRLARALIELEYQQAKAEAAVAAVEAAQARKRSEELERLMTFSQALANALDETTLQHVLWRYLPAFAGERQFWLLTRKLDRWRAFLRDTTVDRSRPAKFTEKGLRRCFERCELRFHSGMPVLRTKERSES